MKIKGILVLSILVVLCFGLLWAYNGPGKNAPEPQDQGQALVNALSTANHQIDWGTATFLIANQKGNLKTNLTANAAARVTKGTSGGTFAVSAIQTLINQPGVIGLKYYFAQNTDGTPTIVLVAVNGQGKTMTAMALEGAFLCPPYCGD
ncbi:MAG: hypothetical protein ABR936_06895 [Bacteroidota bacterium]|jgi:hypothetical protein